MFSLQTNRDLPYTLQVEGTEYGDGLEKDMLSVTSHLEECLVMARLWCVEE